MTFCNSPAASPQGAALGTQDSQEIERLRVVGVGTEDLPVKRLGPVQPAGPVIAGHPDKGRLQALFRARFHLGGGVSTPHRARKGGQDCPVSLGLAGRGTNSRPERVDQ